ncbi:cAMP-binding domain of CRP or a regulatory subunit of cAMP-dependent protein kinases [Chryseobacterium soldanellicola]|uniref:cAMP-binding domain of CRP or a regulatory subunit of cAMP-dependent protein kinases n=1 Tax=Chryseobacterium soldanellicola TaxID=311333 RepID=A0A1H1GE84_9FLAO|nr:Crp/Fnr family transcriptional regulator [Chryseobacterium soldanellicola]SDR11208.1 cAMP-binding domain of CRP or a regulatory subunit of cAMP-dependent protein kinases [Chryseobacterium soldanellicola]
MVISEEILYSMGANVRQYDPAEIIFNEGDSPCFYYQIITGEVKLNNYNEDGKEIIQNLLKDGQSIGESLLFMDKPYPINAVTTTSCNIIRLPKNIFMDLLKQNPDVCFDMNTHLSQNLYYKLLMGQTLSSQNPAVKLKTLMDYLKSFHNEDKPFSFKIPLTRQQMASLTGLCVETVIRALKKMERDNMVQIENRKILY